MGGLISLLKDVKKIIKDLKLTLKITVKVVLKAHKIMDDLEKTMNNLKSTVDIVSTKFCGQQEIEKSLEGGTPSNQAKAVPIDSLLESLETTACSLKTSVRATISTIMEDKGLGNFVDKWRRVTDSNAGAKFVKICPVFRKDIAPKLVELDSLFQDLQPSKSTGKNCCGFDTTNANVQMKLENGADKNTSLSVKGKKMENVMEENILKQIHMSHISWLTSVYLGSNEEPDEHFTSFFEKESRFHDKKQFEGTFQRGVTELMPGQRNLRTENPKEIMACFAVYLIFIHTLSVRGIEYPNDVNLFGCLSDQNKFTMHVADITELE